jgi:hypothetical protein
LIIAIGSTGAVLIAALVVAAGAAAAVGTGEARGADARSAVAILEIAGGDFLLTAKGGGTALGSGSAGVATLAIRGGRFNLSAASAAAVGAVALLEIASANVTVVSASVGIGNADALVFSGASVIDCRPGVSACVAGDIIDVNGSIVGVTSTPTFFPSDPPIEIAVGAELFIRYRAASERENIAMPALHLGRFVGLPMADCQFTFTNADWNKTVLYRPSEAMGLLVSLVAVGNYTVEFSALNSSGRLCNGSSEFFVVGDEDAFVAEAAVCGFVERTATKRFLPSASFARTRPLSSTRSFTRSGWFDTPTALATASVEPPDAKSETGLIIAIGSTGAVLIAALVVAAVLCHRRRSAAPLQSLASLQIDAPVSVE